jgi:hypothetical protein
MSDLQLVTISEIVDKLITINIKLFNVLDKAAEFDKIQDKTISDLEQIAILSGENIKLIKLRSFLKSSLDKKLKEAIKTGNVEVLEEVKKYS